MRISLGLALLTISVLLAADCIGLLPDGQRSRLYARAKACEILAVHCALAAQRGDLATIQASMRALSRDAEVRSAGFRSVNGALVVEVGDHQQHWRGAPDGTSTPTHARVPVFRDGERSGTVEVCFRPLRKAGVLGFCADPFVQCVVFVAAAGFLAHLLFLRKTLRHLDPEAVIPQRVKSALDVLAEGVLVLDANECIVMANQAFCEMIGPPTSPLMGSEAKRLGWDMAEPERASGGFPWTRALVTGETQRDVRLVLEAGSKGQRTLMVNAAPIVGYDGKARGVMVTLNDVTALEQKNAQLEDMLSTLAESQEKVHRKNRMLQVLAMRDALTGCLNRRSFFERFESEWASAQRHGHPLACVMFDIDHFKAVNDQHGHATGDTVLQTMAAAVQSTLRKSDAICRYGGEEFCILLPHTDLDHAEHAAERLRTKIASRAYSGTPVTASFGVSSTEHGAATPQELIEQADNALYAAKNNGRNRTIRWDDERAPARGAHTGAADELAAAAEPPISVQAVNVLLAALARRDITTAEHCRHTAELCVAGAQGLLSATEVFVLEIAAQLHDIGKLGVPDAILLKPYKLTEAEWDIMRSHDRMGVEIIASAFPSPALTEIMSSRHAWYGGNTVDADLPTGDDIPLGARILALADAFSSMVSDRPYRDAMTYDQAFAELRRCAGTQFDPHLVEHFVQAVQARGSSHHTNKPAYSHTVTLGIGQEVGRLVDALDRRDIGTLTTIAVHLAAVAAKQGMPHVSRLAREIGRAASEDRDPIRVLELTTDLMEYYQGVTSTMLESVGDERPTSPPLPQSRSTSAASPKSGAFARSGV